MGHGHRHGHDPAADDAAEDEAAAPVSHGARLLLVALLVPILLATAVALLLLWPGKRPPVSANVPTLGVASNLYDAQVVSVATARCQGTSQDRLPDGTIPATVACPSVVARMVDGPEAGRRVTVDIPVQVYKAGIRPNDLVQLTRFSDVPSSPGTAKATAAGNAAATGPESASAPAFYAWVDFKRTVPLGVLAIGFALLVIAVARLRGLAALAGLGMAYLTIVKFMLPALRLGEDPALVSLAGSIAVMAVILYVAHGLSAKTSAAFLGTVAGLGITTGLATWATHAAHLSGMGTEESYTLSILTGGRDLSGLVICGIIVSGLGVLNDVTVTQASAVWEIQHRAPHLPWRSLFSSGMRIGRDHLNSTVYTIAFASAGAALPTLILIDIYQRPVGQVLTSLSIAEEIARTAIGAIGLILAIPITTGLAAALATTRVPTSGALARNATQHRRQAERASAGFSRDPGRDETNTSQSPSSPISERRAARASHAK